MLEIQKNVLEQIRDAFLSRSDTEQGFLLGSRCNLEQIDVCCSLPVTHASTYFIVPDAQQAGQQIERWAEQNICFCGMIHSHVQKKDELSEADILFAEQLYHAYSLPILWFGIGIVEPPDVRFKFFKLAQNSAQFSISPVNYTIASYRRT